MKVVLATQLSPIISGQVAMTSLLLEESSKWEEIELIGLNFAYAGSRKELGSFTLGKVFLMAKYGALMIRNVIKHDAEYTIITPSFLIKPLMKDSAFILLLALFTNTKIIGWVHMDPSRIVWSKRNRFIKKYFNYIFELVDVWVACSPKLLRSWPEFIPHSRRFVTNGIYTPERLKVVEKVFETINVTYFAAMEEQKGWYDLFIVANRICELREDVAFDFYGPKGIGESRDLEDIFSKTSFKDRIKWHGPKYGEDKVRALERGHIFVLPSNTEQFPLSILEAMAYEFDILASDVGGIEDSVDAEDLFPARDRKTMLKKLLSKLTNLAEIKKRGLGYKEKFEAGFQGHRFGSDWEKLLEDLKS